MTDTEAKALALVNAHAINRRSDLYDALPKELRCALLLAVQSQAATEARRAAELRELKERFGEVAGRAVKHLDLTYYSKGSPSQIEREVIVAGLAPFIIPAPDPLVEVLTDMECPDAASIGRELRAAMQARGYEWRKIGEAGE